MKKQSPFQLLLAAALVASPFLYLATVWIDMPETIPLHWGIDGKPNRFGAKSELLGVLIFLEAIAVGVYLLLTNISKIDPKKTAAYAETTMSKIALAQLVLISGLSLFIIHSTLQTALSNDRIIFVALGLFFAFMGNLMHSIKPNYFAGIRTPWTLNNDDNWRKTHQLGSKLWFAGGIAITIFALFLPREIMIFAMMAIILIMTVVPIGYSYQLFRQSERH